MKQDHECLARSKRNKVWDFLEYIFLYNFDFLNEINILPSWKIVIYLNTYIFKYIGDNPIKFVYKYK